MSQILLNSIVGGTKLSFSDYSLSFERIAPPVAILKESLATAALCKRVSRQNPQLCCHFSLIVDGYSSVAFNRIVDLPLKNRDVWASSTRTLYSSSHPISLAGLQPRAHLSLRPRSKCGSNCSKKHGSYCIAHCAPGQ